MAPTHVLVPLDGSPVADDTLTHALETFDCRLTVLNVVTPLDESMSEGGILEPSDNRRARAADCAERMVERARERAAAAGRRVETEVESGDPADTIVAYVEDHGVDHVVMGGHGGTRDELARRLLGTVATAVVGRPRHRHRRPVTVVSRGRRRTADRRRTRRRLTFRASRPRR